MSCLTSHYLTLNDIQAANKRDLIAMYAAALGDNAVRRYASFLNDLGVTTSMQERKLALHQAAEHGLNVQDVAETTAEMSMATALEVCSLKWPLLLA